MNEKVDDLRARAESAESTLVAIHAAIGWSRPPESSLDDSDLILVITELLESHGMPLVAPDAFEPVEAEPEQLPLLL